MGKHVRLAELLRLEMGVSRIRGRRHSLALLVAFGLIWAGVVGEGGRAADDAPQSPGTNPILANLTQRPLAVLSVESPAASLRAVAGTRVGTCIADSLTTSPELSLWLSQLRWMASNLTGFPDATLERLLGRHAALVVFEGDGAPGRPVPWAVALYLGEDTELVNNALHGQFISWLRASNPALTVTSEQVAGGGIVSVDDGTKEVCLRVAGDRLLVGTREAVLKFEPSAAAPPASHEQQTPEHVASTSFDLGAIWRQTFRRMARNPEKVKELRGMGLPAISALRIRTGVADGGFTDTLIAEVGPQEQGFLPRVMALKPRRARAAALVPQDYGLLASLQIESGEALYSLVEGIVRLNKGEAGVEEFKWQLDQLDVALTVNVQWELLPVIGSEAFLALRTPRAEAWARGAKLQFEEFEPVFGFEVKNEDGLAELVRRFAHSFAMQSQGWQLSSNAHRGTAFQILENIYGGERIAFAFLEGFVVCSLEVAPLQGVIAAVTEGRALADDPEYRVMCDRVQGVGNAWVYISAGPAREFLTGLLSRVESPGAQPLVSVLRQGVARLGSYGIQAARTGEQIRVEAYGDVPGVFTFFSLLASLLKLALTDHAGVHQALRNIVVAHASHR